MEHSRIYGMEAKWALNRIHRGGPVLDSGAESRDWEVFVHRLKVEEAMTSDAGKNIIRIDSSSMILLGIKTGDIVVLRGHNGGRAAAMCADSMLLEIEPVIRLDKILRYNLAVKIEDSITSESIECVTGNAAFCSELNLEPISLGIPAAVDERYIGRALKGMPVVSRQVVLVPYFGGTWYPYAVSGVNSESDQLEEPAIVGSTTVIHTGWQD